MGSESALAVRYEAQPLKGCTRLQSELCHDFAHTLVGCAAGVIGAGKPVSLFSYAPSVEMEGTLREQRAAVREVVCACGRGLSSLGLHVEPVGCVRDRMMLLAWRADLVRAVLLDRDKRELLRAAGFSVSGVSTLMCSVRERLAGFYGARAGAHRASFPHELGVLFGYPVEDVQGFLEGRCATCRGPWCAYGDKEQAQRRFARLESCEALCKQRFRSGERLGDLLREPV